MKTNRIYPMKNQPNGRSHGSRLGERLNNSSLIRSGIARTKEEVIRQHSASFQGQERLLKLALNEAEAIAWQTDYPHLVFPQLAFEKAQAAVSWQQRQKSIQGHLESAFAE